MQAVLAELESVLAGLVERDLPGALVVACSDVETLYLAQVLARLDERSESDLFLTFTDAAPTAAALVDALADNLALQQANLAELLGPATALPALPALARDTSRPPADRLAALVHHLLDLLPAGDHRLVLAVVPSRLPADFSGELAGPLLRRPQHPRLRLVLRDDRARPDHFTSAEACPDEHVLAYSLDLAPADAVAAAVAAARDPERPAAARIQALMELAYLDLGHGRLADAAQKFSGCAEFHARAGNPALAALALAGVGDVQRARGDFVAARRTYESALLEAAATPAFPVTLQVVLALADTCLALAQHADAEAYYQLADLLAGKLLRPHTRADVQESLGVCRLARGAGDEAARAWEEAAELCRVIDYPQRLHSLLGRLAAHHEPRDRARQRTCLEEQAALAARLKEARSC
ncbi:hypothetical protein SAMN02745121_06637 [Nannocystis exedens]|uniref:Uncharacterized protein n=1 Tax=Nannocystis exedens TaxID=54 RepID=A0A1I2FHJ4_9BACT|nr:hypothetical protein [Nannocystis exedens]PCC70455.1 hypothetical protein NAEX_03498 [Nannocystis exedens]SFF04070.1 hypothetical protein SAMN02745121_06637 [Nannocystis exedens]